MKSLAIWLFVIVFFAISIVDHMDAATAAFTTPIPAAPSYSRPLVTAGLLMVISVIDAVAIGVLGTVRMTSYLHVPQ